LSGRFRKFLAQHQKSTVLTFFIGSLIVLTIIFMAVLAPIISPYDPLELGVRAFKPPDEKNPLGTDTVGRDVLSRTIWGSRASLMVAFISILISITIGSLLGSMVGYVGGTLDRMITSVVDALYAFPTYIFALMIVVILGPQVLNIAMAVGVSFIPQYYRVVRSIVLSIKERLFIESEKALGASSLYIVRQHILPYAISSIIVLMSMGIADSILTVAGLGFLGIGIQPPTPEWGTDMRFGRDVFLIGGWWVSVAPGIMIFLSVMGFNLFGEGLNALFQERGGQYGA